MKLFLIGGMEALNFNYCYKITYESGETYDRRRNELSVQILLERYAYSEISGTFILI